MSSNILVHYQRPDNPLSLKATSTANTLVYEQCFTNILVLKAPRLTSISASYFHSSGGTGFSYPFVPQKKSLVTNLLHVRHVTIACAFARSRLHTHTHTHTHTHKPCHEPAARASCHCLLRSRPHSSAPSTLLYQYSSSALDTA
jgi:hypothetical protein